jgi:hypothetical protein
VVVVAVVIIYHAFHTLLFIFNYFAIRETAKRTVETAIEQNEEAALRFIEAAV